MFVFQSYIYFYSCLIELSGDVEKNPGPEFKPYQNFSICHWNFNSIAAHNFFKKIQSLIAYNCIHHFNIICLSEIYLYVMSNYIPNETKVFNDQNPPWINPEIEKKKGF